MVVLLTDTFGVLLRYVYTNAPPKLAEEHRTQDGVAALFDAADRFLVFPLKAGSLAQHWNLGI